MKRLKIGPYNFRIDVDIPADDDTHGQIFFYHELIRLRQGMTPCSQGVKLCHEALHGLFFVSGLKIDHDMEEAICTAMETRLYDLIRENPEFVKLLSSGVESGPQPPQEPPALRKRPKRRRKARTP